MIRKSFLYGMVITACLFGQGHVSGNANPGKPTDPGNPGGKVTPTDPGNPGGNGKPTDPGNSGNGGGSQSDKSLSIQWLTAEADIDQALLNGGKAKVNFKSSLDLENLEVWLTPSLSDLTANPAEFPKIVKDTVYTITLQLQDKLGHTLGGTLHLRSSDGGSRTFAPPLPLNVRVTGESGAQQQGLAVTAVVSSANNQNGSVTPGQMVSVFGSGIGPDKGAGLEVDSRGRASTYLADTQVLFNGIPAPLLAASSTLVKAVVPQAVASDPVVNIVVTFQGSISPVVTLPVKPTSPALFTADGSGQGQSVALNPDGGPNSPEHPADRGTAVVLFGSGFGEWNEAIPDGSIIGSVLPTPKSQVSVTIGGVAAKVLSAFGAPGTVSGVVQINAEIPASITPGDNVTVVVSVGGQSSPANVTVSVD